MADVIYAAAVCGECKFLCNQTKNYNLMHNQRVLLRDKILDDYCNILSDPLIIIKASDGLCNQ